MTVDRARSTLIDVDFGPRARLLWGAASVLEGGAKVRTYYSTTSRTCGRVSRRRRPCADVPRHAFTWAAVALDRRSLTSISDRAHGFPGARQACCRVLPRCLRALLLPRVRADGDAVVGDLVQAARNTRSLGPPSSSRSTFIDVDCGPRVRRLWRTARVLKGATDVHMSANTHKPGARRSAELQPRADRPCVCRVQTTSRAATCR